MYLIVMVMVLLMVWKMPIAMVRWMWVKRTHQTYGVTIVLVSHQIEVVRYMCDRVLHLEQGRIKRLGPIQKAPQFHVETMEQIWGMPDV